jgi:hypothetical protein
MIHTVKTFIILVFLSFGLAATLSCFPDTNPVDNSGTHHQPQTINLDLFPFEDQTNWWKYSDGQNHLVTITVVDTISADTELFYKVRFEESGKDTTLDWFVKTPNGIEFGSSIRAAFSLFLPKTLTKPSGTFTSSTGEVAYDYDSIETVTGKAFHDAVTLNYTTPVLHGFNRILFADSIGLISLIDSTGRFPTVYTIDSCSIGGTIRHF